MKRRFRLSGSANFQRVRRSGRIVRHPLLVMAFLPNDLETLRIGVAAGRVVGNAVKRNRAKRLIRHAVSDHLASIPAGWDLIFTAREPLAAATFQQVQEALLALLLRSGLISESHELENR